MQALPSVLNGCGHSMVIPGSGAGSAEESTRQRAEARHRGAEGEPCQGTLLSSWLLSYLSNQLVVSEHVNTVSVSRRKSKCTSVR